MNNDLFNISESIREETAAFVLNQPPLHAGDSCCEDEVDENEWDFNSFPGEPFINKLQRSYKLKKAVPAELLMTLNSEGMRHLVEILIHDTLNLRKLRDGKKTPTSSDSESDNYKLSNNFSTTSFTKQPTFPLSHPIAREELKIRRNNNLSTYQKVELAHQQPESISITPIAVKMGQPEKYDETILKLYNEITEAKDTKKRLMQVIRLSPNKLKISGQIDSVLDLVNKHKHKYHALIQDTGKIKIYSKLATFGNWKQRPTRKKFRELQSNEKAILKSIIKAYDTQNPKNLREYAYSLMKEFEASEVTSLLVKYTCVAELELFGELLFQTACMKQVLDTQESMQELLNSQNQMKQKLIQQLKFKIKNRSTKI